MAPGAEIILAVRCFNAIAMLTLLAPVCGAQVLTGSPERLTSSPEPLTIGQAVEQARKQYPAIRAALEQAKSAAAGVDVARTAYLPRLDVLGQVNRATRNNVFGLLLPQSTLPTISGPPLATNSLDSVWGSAVGVTTSWEPFDFGQRQARVDEALSGQKRAEYSQRRIEFEVMVRAADAWLAALANERAVVAAQAGLIRARTLLTVSDALVRSELRPGADSSRGRAELARAQTELLQGRRNAGVARAELAGLLGVDASALTLDPGKLVDTLPSERADSSPEHPAVAEQQAAIDQVRAGRTVLDRSWYPRLNAQASSYARGTGALADGRTLDGVNGLGPNIHNWAVGFTATFPVFDYASIRARSKVEMLRERSEAARLEQVKQDLSTALGRARLELTTALAIAQQTPVQLSSAREAEQQASARYQAGLSSVVDLADAQRLVTQSEIEDALARLTAWRALLRVSAAAGDPEIFMRQANQ